jgi:hypothetical protein
LLLYRLTNKRDSATHSSRCGHGADGRKKESPG